MRRRWAVALTAVALLIPGSARAEVAPPMQAARAMNPALLQATLDAAHAAGGPGLAAVARDGDRVWRGAAGAADTDTGRPARSDQRQRVGEVTMTFTATAVLQQAQRGRIDLDAPIARYIPADVPGPRGRQITVRMLLQHTSGLGDYLPRAFPSRSDWNPASFDAGRTRALAPSRLIAWGLAEPATGAPGEKYAFSRTNYILAGRLLAAVTGETAEAVITRDVIRAAGLTATTFPDGPGIDGPHPRMYEHLHGQADPPRDYSRYDMSYLGTAGALISTMDDLTTFYRALFTGRLLGPATLAEMRRTVPVPAPDDPTRPEYGLGLALAQLPCGTFWGHTGTPLGTTTRVLSTSDATRQSAVTVNTAGHQQLDGDGSPVPHPLDNATGAHTTQSLCGTLPPHP
ncbi:serine hydrolase domain-containing protein [Actinomadura flavalba]|uniref:serine hydrolase domain-containing protein n=1 Tax=Actinomadura flavalba TaxID=1120938 RepID=UPI0012DCA5F5|nr:serine hydrolase domain-containing protein [Actinomadura flavalba]